MITKIVMINMGHVAEFQRILQFNELDDVGDGTDGITIPVLFFYLIPQISVNTNALRICISVSLWLKMIF